MRKWGRRHRGAVAAAAVVLLVMLVAAGAFGWRELRQQAETEQLVKLALTEATTFKEANKVPEALVAVRQAEWLLESRGGSGALRRQTQKLRGDLDMISALGKNCLLVEPLRSGGREMNLDTLGADHVHSNFQEAFRTYRIDVEALDLQEAGQRLREQDICRELLAALDHWAWYLIQKGKTKKETWKRLLWVARLADADDGWNQVRLAIE
jgi:hypothetical protein